MIVSGIFAPLVLAAAASADVLRVPVARIPPGAVTRQDLQPHLSKRASFTEFLVNNITGGGYYASISVGSPGQALNLILDTGSSDAFLVAKDANICQSKMLQAYHHTTCGHTFDPSQSSTYQVLIPDGFRIGYLDGSNALGDYITDKFEIGGATVDALQMGLAKKTITGTGVLGIGFTANEAAADEYPNLVDQMVDQGLIPSRAYSLYLNDYDSSTGSILFGGVDSEKFWGELVIVPVLPDAQTQNYTTFTVGMTALSFTFPNGTTHDATLLGGSLNALLDSGTTLTYLPPGIAMPILTALGAYTHIPSPDAIALSLVDCALASSGLEFTFRFNDAVTIVVPVDELIINAYRHGGAPQDAPFAETCIFGVQNSGHIPLGDPAGLMSLALLGDTFLRSAYVVYDIDNRKLGLAQANLNSTESNIQEMKAGLFGLPVYTGAARPEPNGSAVSNTGMGTSKSTSSKGAIGMGTLSLVE